MLHTDAAHRPCVCSTMGGFQKPTAHVSLHCATSKYEHMCSNAPSFCGYCAPPGCCCTLGSQLAWLNQRNTSHLLHLNKTNQIRHSQGWLSEQCTSSCKGIKGALQFITAYIADTWEHGRTATKRKISRQWNMPYIKHSPSPRFYKEVHAQVKAPEFKGLFQADSVTSNFSARYSLN